MKYQVFTLLLLTVFFLSSNAQTQEKKTDGIHWMSFTEAVKATEKNPKKIFIDVYTKWCGWCKRMDASTYEDVFIIDYMNKNYYSVKLDAETRDTIKFHDKIFVYKPELKANEIALSLLDGQMSYPTSVYLDESFTRLTPDPGYQSSDQLMPKLKYFAENIYKNKKFEDYLKGN